MVDRMYMLPYTNQQLMDSSLCLPTMVLLAAVLSRLALGSYPALMDLI